jgi:nucleotide-binding universal stress UspA family protein
LLYVLEPTIVVAGFGTVPVGAVRSNVASRARAALEALARAEFPESIPVTVTVRKGAPYDQIVAAARDMGADVIIVPTYGRTGLKHALLGSTAERVARHAPCPVLILRRRPAP